MPITIIADAGPLIALAHAGSIVVTTDHNDFAHL
jgi:hypothetical protein